MRLDLYLVAKGFAPSRTRAQNLIAQGRVALIAAGRKQVITKSSYFLEGGLAGKDFQIEVTEDLDGDRFVSRGGFKMLGALERTRLDVKGFRVLDLGISTGGFTDCLLQAGAHSVVGVDVGHGQLALRLTKNPNVQLIEGVNARNLTTSLDFKAGPIFDLIVADVSFISLTLVLPEAIQYLKEGARVLALVKPQFEVGRNGLGKGGIVKDESLYPEVEAKIRQCCKTLKLEVEAYFESSIEGTDGNREFFVYAAEAMSRAQLTLGMF